MTTDLRHLIQPALARRRRQDIGVNDLLQAHGSRRSFRFAEELAQIGFD